MRVRIDSITPVALYSLHLLPVVDNKHLQVIRSNAERQIARTGIAVDVCMLLPNLGDIKVYLPSDLDGFS